MKMATSPDTDDMRDEYDFRAMKGVVRGKYAGHGVVRLRTVRLAADVAAVFPDDAAVNDALREVIRNRAKQPAK